MIITMKNLVKIPDDDIIEIIIHYTNQKGEEDTRLWNKKNSDKVAKKW